MEEGANDTVCIGSLHASLPVLSGAGVVADGVCPSMGNGGAPCQQVLRGVFAKTTERAASIATCDSCPICDAVGAVSLGSKEGAWWPVFSVVLEFEDVSPAVSIPSSCGKAVLAPADACLLQAGGGPGNECWFGFALRAVPLEGSAHVLASAALSPRNAACEEP